MKTILFYNQKNETVYSLKLFVCNKSCYTIMLLLLFLNLNAQTVTTYAGCTINGYSYGYADGPVSTAQFSQPSATAIDYTTGTMYVSDTSNNVIRKITTAGNVTTILDTNGINAAFSGPGGLAIDSGGTLYVVDRGSNCIRKITLSGDVTTVAGSASATGSVDGTGNLARFNYPLGIVIDNLGNLFVTDSFNHRIRKITPTGDVSTFAGSTIGYSEGTGTAAKFNYPEGITIDSNNNLYVADTGNNVIRKITPLGEVTTYVSNPYFFSPKGLTMNASGTLYVSSASHNIYEISPTGIIFNLAGYPGLSGYVDGYGGTARFTQPKGVTLDQSQTNLYVAEFGNNRIRKIALKNLGTNTFSTNKFLVYPNPVKDILTIQNLENHSIEKISITDISGKKVLDQKENSNTINVEKLQQGTYLMEIISEGKNSVMKFIKN